MSDSSTVSGETVDHPQSLLTVKNSLLSLTIVLVAAILLLAGNVMLEANRASNLAEQSMELNSASDDLTQMMLSVATERTAVGTAFGFDTVPDSSFRELAASQRRSAVLAYEVFLEDLGRIPDFAEKKALIAAVNNAWKTYDEMGAQLAADLNAPSDSRVLRLREIVRAQNGLIDAASSFRSAFELAFNTGNARIEAVKQLKRQLWLMLEYSARDSSAIGENIASGEPLSSVKLQVVSQYGGVVRAAWSLVQNIARSELADNGIRSQIDAIDETFFGDFDLLRDDVYTAAEFEEPYPVTAQEWVDESNAATEPVNRMSAAADTLSRTLNEDAVSAAATSFVIALVGMILALALGVFGIWVVLFRVVRPINEISSTMQELAKGRILDEVPHTARGDEVGAMARSVQVFKENAIERQRLEAERQEAEKAAIERKAEEERQRLEQEAADREREEKRRTEARAERRRVMLELADRFEASVSRVVDGVSQSASDMESAAQGLAATAKQTSAQSDTVAHAAEQASSNANMVASAAEELSSSVREITGQTNQSSASARDAVGRTERASKDVSELESAAQKIGEVVSLINDIAEQTNLLALNATIEAARAGDAGKGFAVVASEVKSLASQTAKATEEISGQVLGMQQATTTAVNAMDDIRNIITEIESTAVSIASAVEEQDASTQEIARNVAEVSTGTEEVTSNIRGVSDGASSTGQSASSVLDAAQRLTQQSSELRGEVDSFLAQIRSADA